jgi:hypothetical protein
LQKKTPTSTTTPSSENANSIQEKELRGKADFFSQAATTFGTSINSAGTGGGQMASYDHQIEQAKEKQIADLEGGLAMALNTLVSLIGSQEQTIETERSNTYQLMSGLQNVRA